MREWLDRVWPSLVALVGTVGVVVVLLVLFGDSTGGSSADDVAAGDQGGGAEPGDGTGTGEPEPSDSSTGGSPGEEPDGESTADPGEGDEEGSNEELSDEPTTAPPELRSPVGIANQTTVEGLELIAKERLEEGGWDVPAVSGFTGNVPETTVYYPPGMREYAEALSRQFPEIGRVNETFEGINQERLVVVLVDDYLASVDE